MTRDKLQAVGDRLEVERSLRASALEAKSTPVERRASISIIADFYEQHGQLSRAALWREQLLDRHPMLSGIPDLLTRPHRSKAFDCRRSQMVWLLRKQGVSVRKVASAFGISATRVEQIVSLEDERIRMHAKNEQLWPTLKATERLIAAGALAGDRPTRSGYQESWFDLCDEPPEDWPAEHKRPRK